MTEPIESEPQPTPFIKTIRWKMLLWVAICTVGVFLLGAPHWVVLLTALWLLYQENTL